MLNAHEATIIAVIFGRRETFRLHAETCKTTKLATMPISFNYKKLRIYSKLMQKFFPPECKASSLCKKFEHIRNTLINLNDMKTHSCTGRTTL